MTFCLKTFQWLAVAVVVHTSLAAAAAAQPNPYEGIPVRNVFHLVPMPTNPPVAVPERERRTLPKIFITGLVELGGVSKALVEITEPGQPVQRSILAAGGASGVLQVLDVDVAGERVRVRIGGDEETLSIEKPRTAAAPLPPLPPPPRPPVALRG